MPLYPIDLLNIRDNDSRKQHYEKLIKNANEHKKLFKVKTSAWMLLLHTFSENAYSNADVKAAVRKRVIRVADRYMKTAANDPKKATITLTRHATLTSSSLKIFGT